MVFSSSNELLLLNQKNIPFSGRYANRNEITIHWNFENDEYKNTINLSPYVNRDDEIVSEEIVYSFARNLPSGINIHHSQNSIILSGKINIINANKLPPSLIKDREHLRFDNSNWELNGRPNGNSVLFETKIYIVVKNTISLPQLPQNSDSSNSSNSLRGTTGFRRLFGNRRRHRNPGNTDYTYKPFTGSSNSSSSSNSEQSSPSSQTSKSFTLPLLNKKNYIISSNNIPLEKLTSSFDIYNFENEFVVEDFEFKQCPLQQHNPILTEHSIIKKELNFNGEIENRYTSDIISENVDFNFNLFNFTNLDKSGFDVVSHYNTGKINTKYRYCIEPYFTEMGNSFEVYDRLSRNMQKPYGVITIREPDLPLINISNILNENQGVIEASCGDVENNILTSTTSSKSQTKTTYYILRKTFLFPVLLDYSVESQINLYDCTGKIKDSDNNIIDDVWFTFRDSLKNR